MPDIAVFFENNLPARGPLTRIPPDIAVEILSRTPRDQRRDRIEKRREYAAFGVRFDWLVDPWVRTVEILELDRDGRDTIAFGAAEGRHTSVPGCEGLVLDLDLLWATIDRLQEPSDDGD